MASNYDKSLLLAKVLRRIPHVQCVARPFNRWRHRRIRRDLDGCLSDALEMSGQQPVVRDSSYPDRIWVFWWQGLDDAPRSVKACISSVEAFAGGRKVTVITRGNIDLYAGFSDRIHKLVEEGAITLTHLSDLLRYRLLSRYGGLWLDASMYVTAPLPVISSDSIYTCGGYPDPVEFNVSEGRWLGGLIGGPAGHPMFRFMDAFFSLYWMRNDKLIDYFLIDYAVEYAWSNNIGGFADDCRRASGRNPKLFELRRYLDEPFDDHIWAALRESTSIFMISYKWVREIRSNSFADRLLRVKGIDEKEPPMKAC